MLGSLFKDKIYNDGNHSSGLDSVDEDSGVISVANAAPVLPWPLGSKERTRGMSGIERPSIDYGMSEDSLGSLLSQLDASFNGFLAMDQSSKEHDDSLEEILGDYMDDPGESEVSRQSVAAESHDSTDKEKRESMQVRQYSLESKDSVGTQHEASIGLGVFVANPDEATSEASDASISKTDVRLSKVSSDDSVTDLLHINNRFSIASLQNLDLSLVSLPPVIQLDHSTHNDTDELPVKPLSLRKRILQSFKSLGNRSRPSTDADSMFEASRGFRKNSGSFMKRFNPFSRRQSSLDAMQEPYTHTDVQSPNSDACESSFGTYQRISVYNPDGSMNRRASKRLGLLFTPNGPDMDSLLPKIRSGSPLLSELIPNEQEEVVEEEECIVGINTPIDSLDENIEQSPHSVLLTNYKESEEIADNHSDVSEGVASESPSTISDDFSYTESLKTESLAHPKSIHDRQHQPTESEDDETELNPSVNGHEDVLDDGVAVEQHRCRSLDIVISIRDLNDSLNRRKSC